MSSARERKKKKGEDVAAAPAPPVPAPAAAPEESVEFWRDKALRAQAEMVNLRRRAEQDVDERARLRTEGILQEVIQLADNFELALGAVPAPLRADDGARPLLDGLRAIQASLAILLARQGVEPIEPPPAAAFDPELHEAVLVEERPGLPGPAVELLRRGYRAGRRILRPAQVRLLRPAAAPSPSEPA